MRVPKTTLQFIDFLEGLPELKKAVTFTVIVYCSERVVKKLAKEKGDGAGFRTDQARAATCPLPVLSHEPPMICDSTCGVSPAGEAHPSFARGFYWRPLT